MGKPVPLTAPIKGVNRNFARGAQPDATCYDALNVLPIDRQGRFRIAQRGGLGQLGAYGSSPVRLLHIASTVVES